MGKFTAWVKCKTFLTSNLAVHRVTSEFQRVRLKYVSNVMWVIRLERRTAQSMNYKKQQSFRSAVLLNQLITAHLVNKLSSFMELGSYPGSQQTVTSL